MVDGRANKGLISIGRYFTNGNKKAEDYFTWSRRDVEIKDRRETVIYSGKNLECPDSWSDLSLRVVGHKYLFTGDDRDNPIETSVKQLTSRVVKTLSKQGVKQKVFSKGESKVFGEELSYLVFDQRASFNSPVWFNAGLHSEYDVSRRADPSQSSHWAINSRGRFTNQIDEYERPQGAACFIVDIDDSMESILDNAKTEGMLFKHGSGTGTNFSKLRGINEPLSGGGVASGLISFLRILDIIAGRIQSGGKTRRAAKMVIMDCDHPDLMRFTSWKPNEERKALWLCANPEWGPRDLSDLEGEAYKTVDGQNGNNSVRVTDEFMGAAVEGREWDLWFRTADRFDEEVDIPLEEYRDDRYLPDKRFIRKLTNKRKTINAGEALEQIARAAYVTGDPGLQFDTTINDWNTCPNSGRIRASNPCSEFMFLDNAACNLASLNLIKFSLEDKLLDIRAFEKAISTTIIGQEILVDHCSYPSKKIAENSHKFRSLGLGYTNIGALLMSKGIAYDSKEGRAIASAITSLMTAKAYETSADLAAKLGAFEEFEENKDPMLNVINKHLIETEAIENIEGVDGLEEILEEAKQIWGRALDKGREHGFRNAQVTLLAPTGTIGFMMGVECTGVEPLLGLKLSKGLAGGGELEMDVPECVVSGLKSLGYNGDTLESIVTHIKETGSVVDAPGLHKNYYKVFATSYGDNNIAVDGHLGMMAAVQPFLSGSISKTVNLPKGSTIKDVKDSYIKAWKLGLKSISLFVDGSKGVQPVNIIQKSEQSTGLEWGKRIKPKSPIERLGVNVKIGNTGVHLITGEYRDRPPKDTVADFFVEFGSSGSPFSAAYSSWAKEASRNRQRGATLAEFVKHNLGASGVINGFTDHPFIKTCSSIEDFYAKLILLEYLGDTSKCDQEPTAEDIANLRCNVLARRRRQEHFRSRIEFIDNVLREGKIIDIYPLYEDELEEGGIAASETFCIVCGHPTVLSGANCRKCLNCGDAPGCG